MASAFIQPRASSHVLWSWLLTLFDDSWMGESMENILPSFDPVAAAQCIDQKLMYTLPPKPGYVTTDRLPV